MQFFFKNQHKGGFANSLVTFIYLQSPMGYDLIQGTHLGGDHPGCKFSGYYLIRKNLGIQIPPHPRNRL